MSKLPPPPPHGISQPDDTSPLIIPTPGLSSETDVEKADRIKLCRKAEAVVGRPMKSPKDFDFLSKCIFDKLHEHVSTSTLKRLWGYVPSSTSPRKTTLDILARFVGVDSWKAFCLTEDATPPPAESCPQPVGVSPSPVPAAEASRPRSSRTPRWLPWTLLMAAVVVAVILIPLAPSHRSASPSSPAVTALGDHAYADLALPSGTLWATTNIGATVPEEYGHYFAWGEVEPKGLYEWGSYKWYHDGTFTKYSIASSYGEGDGIPTLLPADDAAHVCWGDNWRIPTADEWRELQQQCTWEWTSLNGRSGCKVTSNVNGNSIFLPAAGYRFSGIQLDDLDTWGHYWTSSLSAESSACAWNACFNSDHFDCSSFRSFRCNGQSIRPVISK